LLHLLLSALVGVALLLLLQLELFGSRRLLPLLQ
jgi:hypothetical protein